MTFKKIELHDLHPANPLVAVIDAINENFDALHDSLQNVGDSGVIGPAGPKGDAGQDGREGPQGIQGERGLQGEQGPAGQDGKDGAQGEQGVAGVAGTGVGNTIVQNSITIGATTTAPTTGTRTVQRIESQTVGDKFRLTYKLGYAAGSNAGSGHYLLTLPTGVTFNTTYDPLYNGANEWTGDVHGQAPNLIVASGGIVIPGGWSNQIAVVPYDSTRFRLLVTYNGNQGQYNYWGSGFYFAASNTSLNIQFEIWK